MPFILRNLKPYEVSIVGIPANKRKFLILKSGKEVLGMEEILKTIFETPLDNEEEIREKLQKEELDKNVVDVIIAVLKLLEAYKDSLPPDVLARIATLAGYAYGYPPPTEKAEEKEETEEVSKGEDNVIDLESLPENVKPMVEKLWKEHEEVVKKAQELEKALKAEQEERKKLEFINKAKQFKHIPMKPEELGVMLKSLSETNEEMYNKFVQLLTSLDNQIEQSGLFKEIGKSGEAPATAWGKIEAMANELVQKGVVKTKEQGVKKVLEENPELYDEYRKELRR